MSGGPITVCVYMCAPPPDYIKHGRNYPEGMASCPQKEEDEKARWSGSTQSQQFPPFTQSLQFHFYPLLPPVLCSSHSNYCEFLDGLGFLLPAGGHAYCSLCLKHYLLPCDTKIILPDILHTSYTSYITSSRKSLFGLTGFIII